MKKFSILYTLCLSLLAAAFVSCNDWTEMQAESFPEEFTSEEYYAALRDYKQSEHQVSFGWYGGWTGDGAYMKNSLAGLPDSLDIVSLWNNSQNLTEKQKKDLAFVQKVKGTKVVVCQIISNIGDGFTPADVYNAWEEKGYASEQEAKDEFWGFDESKPETIEPAIRKFAKAIVDTINYNGYDGFDIDYEPTAGPYVGNLVLPGGDNSRFAIFIDELSKYLGPKSGTGKLLMIDGEPQSIKDQPQIGHCLDYFVIQAYKPGRDSNLDDRLLGGPQAYQCGLMETFGEELGEERVTKMTIMTENFEAVDAAMNGGYNYTDRYGNSMMSLEGMARWKPTNGFNKGGVGVYHLEAEFDTSPECKNMRNAIQIMNPSSYSLIKK